jgi:hypothetical protein
VRRQISSLPFYFHTAVKSISLLLSNISEELVLIEFQSIEHII